MGVIESQGNGIPNILEAVIMSATLLRASDLTVISKLYAIEIRGFEPGSQTEVIDPPGTANWLVESFGIAAEDGTYETGVIWTDYDAPSDDPWLFKVLVSSHALPALDEFVKEAGGYDFNGPHSLDEVVEPVVFGDGNGTVTLLKHPDGWVVLRS